MARPKSTEPPPERLSVSLPAPDMTRLLALKHVAEREAGKTISLAETVRQAIACLAKENGVA